MKTLPPNSTKLEKNLANTNAAAFDLPSMRLVQDFDQVPEDFLPVLAWQESVDYWDMNLAPSLKRELIKKSRTQHKIKGTPAAVKQALLPFGYGVKLTEWFKQVPEGTPGTFALEIDLIGRELTEEIFKEVNRLVADSKAASRHISNLQITANPVLNTKVVFAHQFAMTFESFPETL